MRAAAQRLLLAVALLLGAAVPLRAHAFEAGAAKQEITPPVGAPLNGYGNRMGRPSISVHDPLWARALYLDDGTTRLFLVNADLCFINPELRARVLEIAPPEVPKENIILTATHDHSATGGMCRKYPLRFVAGAYSQALVDHTAKNIVAAMRAAYDARKRAAIGFGTTTQDNLSRNRRVGDGPIDPQIGVIKVDDADGNPIAAVTNFTGHPTYVPDADLYVISADYPGIYYNEMERLAGGGCVALFLNGAEGNQGVGNPENKDGWARLESIGRLLAEKANTLRTKIDCSEVPLRLVSAQPELPLSLAGFQPRNVLLQVLEIGDLAMCFVPGEPVVEIGLELRKRALERGYKAQFTIGLANDYLNYFVTRELYPGFYYETGMSFFGPGMADWFYHNFATLYSKGAAPEVPKLATAPAKQVLGGAEHVVLSGTPREMGQQRGQVFADDIRAKYNERIHEPVKTGAAFPSAMPWGVIPDFVDMTPLAPALMGGAMRPRLTGISPELYAEVEGLAEGAGLPFDAAWLLQNARETALRQDKAPLFAAPLCTMAAVAQPEGGLLVARNLDWDKPELSVITEYVPEAGLRFLQVGFGWNAGVFTGMNEAGLVLCVEHVEGLGEPDLQVPPIEMHLRDVLATKGTAADAVAALRAVPGQRGYHVLVAGPGANGFESNVIEYGKEVVVRAPEDGVLLGVSPVNPSDDDDALIRHARVADLLATSPARGVETLQKILTDSESGRAAKAQIWNPNTRHAVVFDPQHKTLYVSIPKADGTPGPFQRVLIGGGKAS